MRKILVASFILILAAGIFITYHLKYSPKALRTHALQATMADFTEVVARGNSDDILKFLDRHLAPEATVTLSVTYQAIAFNDDQKAPPQIYTREGFMELARLITTNLKGYGMRFTLQGVDFTGGLDSPTATARGEQWAEGNMYQQGGVQSTYKTALDCTAKLRIASMQDSYFPTISACNCNVRIQAAPKMDAQNLGRVRDTILLNQTP